MSVAWIKCSGAVDSVEVAHGGRSGGGFDKSEVKAGAQGGGGGD